MAPQGFSYGPSKTHYATIEQLFALNLYELDKISTLGVQSADAKQPVF